MIDWWLILNLLVTEHKLKSNSIIDTFRSAYYWDTNVNKNGENIDIIHDFDFIFLATFRV